MHEANSAVALSTGWQNSGSGCALELLHSHSSVCLIGWKNTNSCIIWLAITFVLKCCSFKEIIEGNKITDQLSCDIKNSDKEVHSSVCYDILMLLVKAVWKYLLCRITSLPQWVTPAPPELLWTHTYHTSVQSAFLVLQFLEFCFFCYKSGKYISSPHDEWAARAPVSNYTSSSALHILIDSSYSLFWYSEQYFYRQL